MLSTIKEILKENNLTPKDVDLIGVNVGPGSFTGIRAALTVAKVMAQELNIKIVQIESLRILSKLNNSEARNFLISQITDDKSTDAAKSKACEALLKNANGSPIG